MTCAEHNRSHCPEPRCHVLAVCIVEIPEPDLRGVLRSFIRRGGYGLGVRFKADGSVTTHHPCVIAEQIAARLVAWMRWPGERRAGACRGFYRTNTHLLSVDPRFDRSWVEYGPGYWHPLDVVMSHAARRAGLGACGVCRGKGLLWDRQPIKCPHCRGGINWHTVAVLLDTMQDLGIGLDVVHEWRPPS